MREFPRHRNVRKLRGFLGLVEFALKFMKDCSGVMKPLTGKKKSKKYIKQYAEDGNERLLKITLR